MIVDTAFLPVNPETLADLLGKWREASASGGVLALVPEAETDGIAVLQATCRDLNLPLVGAVFPALLDGSTEQRSGVRLINLAPMPPWVLSEGLDRPDGIEAFVESIAALTKDLPAGTEPVLMTVLDSTLPTVGQVLDRFASRFEDRLKYVGVNAGSETFSPIPCLFDQHRIISAGGLALLLDELSKTAVEHGFSTPVTILKVTKSRQNIIETLNGRPAFQVYQEVIADLYGVTITGESFYSDAVHYPLGILSDRSLVQIRIPVGLGEDGAITCVGDVEQGVVAVVIKAPAIEESDCVQRIASRFGPGLAGLLTFYCAGRRMHLGPAKVSQELGQLAVAVGTPNLFGALSLGEIATDNSGDPVFHNAALVCLGVEPRPPAS